MSRMTREAELELCRQYAERIRSYGLRHLRDLAAAQDLVQHVLLAVLQALRAGQVQDESKLGSYVLGTCRNMVMDMRRGEARHRRVASATADERLPEGWEPDWGRLDGVKLENCLRMLDSRARSVVLATYVEDQDADKIATALKVSTGNVRVIRHRALARLQTCLEGRAA
jgi:RNA polymerase sigma-70 factor, ECF subfamily